jgi:hypothetical protein
MIVLQRYLSNILSSGVQNKEIKHMMVCNVFKLMYFQMYLGWTDYVVLVLLLCKSAHTAILSNAYFLVFIDRLIGWHRSLSGLYSFETIDDE